MKNLGDSYTCMAVSLTPPSFCNIKGNISPLSLLDITVRPLTV